MAKLITGQPAPDFCLDDLDGRRVSLADFCGRPVLVNFWSAECPWSARADRALVAQAGAVILLAVHSNANEPVELVRQTARERGLPLVLLDPVQRVADLYGAVTTPHCFLVDEAGILRYQGAFDDVTFRQRTPTRGYVLEALDAVCSGQAVAIADTAPYGCTIVRQYS